MSETYPKSKGGLWTNRNKVGEQPDWRGKIDVTKDQINMLVKMGRSGIKPVLQVGAWKRRSEAGDNYIYLSAEAYIKPEGQPQQQQQQQRPQQQQGWGDDNQQDDNWGQDQQTAPQQQQDDGWGDDVDSQTQGQPDNEFVDDDLPF